MSILVSCAIIEKENKVLVAQRSENMSHPLQWEFPGGKIQEGESAEDCLKREIMEELNISIEIEKALSPVLFEYPDKNIQFFPFQCKWISGELKLLEHQQVLWLEKDKLSSLDWVEADIQILNQYLGN